MICCKLLHSKFDAYTLFSVYVIHSFIRILLIFIFPFVSSHIQCDFISCYYLFADEFQFRARARTFADILVTEVE